MERAVAGGDGAESAARGNGHGILRIVVGASLFAGVLAISVREWQEVSETIAEIGPGPIAASLCLTLLGLVASVLTWRRSLLELGSRVTLSAAMKIYLVGQLGKYIPGSVWALVLQMELARAAAVRRAEALGAGVVAVAINVLTGSAIGLAVVPLLDEGSLIRYGAATAGIACCVLVVTPPILGRVVDTGLRLARHDPLDRHPSWAGIFVASGFSVVNWLLYGLALAVLAIAAGGDPWETLLLALPAVGLALTIGLFVAIAPSGIGVREAVLVAALTPVLDTPAALGVALVLRLVFTLADLLAAVATVPIRITTANAEGA